MRAKTKEELQIGDELAVFGSENGKRILTIHTVTDLTEEVIVDDIYDLSANEDEHYFVLPKL